MRSIVFATQWLLQGNRRIGSSLERALDYSETHEVLLLDNPELQRALAR
jgi:hypothetical protein